VKRAALEAANERLEAHSAEISRQNEELQAQSEELARQNEEIQSQSEELAQQNESLQQQSEELQAQSEEGQMVNAELRHRESMLQALLQAVRHSEQPQQLLQHICSTTVTLFDGRAAAAAVVEWEGDELLIRAHSGMEELARLRWPIKQSFAYIIMEQGRTAYITDLAKRTDLEIPSAKRRFRSILGTPLHVAGKKLGAVEVYSEQPREWTNEDFRIIEWVSAQCGLVLEAIYLNRRLVEANTALEQTVQSRTARLQELVDELEHFSYSITHDMRAPLRAMHGYAAILQESNPFPDNPECRDYLGRIITAAARMDRLILDALSYSQCVRGEMPLQPVDSAALIKGMLDSYPALQSAAAEIKVIGRLPVVMANEAGLTQCFSNLLNNAVKFVSPGTMPEVTIRAEERGGMVRFWFEDNGIGVPAEMRPRIFKMFQRASKEYEGTGIGLALVRKVAERMGGGVGFESIPGHGSRFWIEMKCAHDSVT
jgi:signal transduction histidine kinase